MPDYTCGEHARIMWAWAEVKEWADKVSNPLANDINAMLKAERREPNTDMPAAILNIMDVIHQALENNNKPIYPSKLHMRAALIRVYTSVSYCISYHTAIGKHETENTRIMGIIQSALAIRAAATDRMIAGEAK